MACLSGRVLFPGNVGLLLRRLEAAMTYVTTRVRWCSLGAVRMFCKKTSQFLADGNRPFSFSLPYGP